jgi:hypothetical protein
MKNNIKKIGIFIIVGIMICCNSQNKKEKIESESNQVLNSNQTETQIEMKILSEFATKNNYKAISKEDFAKRCLDFFGLNIEKLSATGYSNINDNSDYRLSIEKQFLRTFSESLFYDPSIDGKVTNEQALATLNNDENGMGKTFLAYNKLLFNDDISTLSYFINNPEIIEVVIDFDYEKNPNFIGIAISEAEKAKLYTDDFNYHFLFYNNREKGFKRDLINKIYQKHNSSFKEMNNNFVDLVYNFSENFKKVPVSQSIKDECVIYIINLLIEFDKKNEANIAGITDELAYVQLSNFLKTDNDFINRIKGNNFFGVNKIKELIESFVVLNNTKTGNPNNTDDITYIINDNDGFTNLRSDKSVNSEILQRINTGSQIEVLDSNGDWWYVQTNEGKKGYVSKSKITEE